MPTPETPLSSAVPLVADNPVAAPPEDTVSEPVADSDGRASRRTTRTVLDPARGDDSADSGHTDTDSGVRYGADSEADGPPAGFVTAEMIAEQLARITGKTSVRASTIRGMASRDQMPAPTDRKWGRKTLWDAAQIDTWLGERQAKHVSRPTVRQIQRRLTELDEDARRTGNDARLKEGVRDAHRRGLSYQQIADAIKVKNGDHHPTREAVRIRFRRYL